MAGSIAWCDAVCMRGSVAVQASTRDRWRGRHSARMHGVNGVVSTWCERVCVMMVMLGRGGGRGTLSVAMANSTTSCFYI